jgi:hypothetical protein
MHLEILDKKQQELLHYLQWFNRSFYLVGGTAIAFHLGHRRSLDFDLATPSTLIKHISLPTLLSLAAMKAFALGRRAKWKDYVDLFFIR